MKNLSTLNNTKLKRFEKKNILVLISDYRNFVWATTPDTSSFFKNDYIYNKNKIEKSLTLITKRCSVLEFITIVSKIKVNIRASQLKLNTYLCGQIDAGDFRFTKFTAYCIPKSKTIPLGKTYEAKIFLGNIDTTKNCKIVIDQDTFQTYQGTYKFKEKARKDEGKVSIEAKFLIESPFTGEFVDYPFTIEYEVVK